MLLTEYADKKILITGGTGFLGKNLVPFLSNLGAIVVAPSSAVYDLTCPEQTRILFETGHYDYILHGASLQGAGDWPLSHTAKQFHINTLIHANVLEAWKDFQPQAKFVGCGSSCSYPGNIIVLREEDYLQGPVHPSLQYYGLTKILMQQGIEAYKEQYPHLRGTTVIFATLYGPHDPLGERAHVVTALIHKFLTATREDLPEVEIWGDGNQTRELIYVDDHIKGLLLVMDYEGTIINIGTGIQTTIRDLAELLKSITGYKGNLVYNPNRFVGVIHKVLNIDLAKKLYGWTVSTPLVSLEDGLRMTLDWYKKVGGLHGEG